MKKKTKLIVIFLVVLFIFPNNVFAGSDTGGESGTADSCDEDDEWCYATEGIRFSLYTYSNGSLSYKGSVDYETNHSGNKLNGRTARVTQDKAGKVIYQNTSADGQVGGVDWKKDGNTKWRNKTLSIRTKNSSKTDKTNSEDFSCFFGSNESNVACSGFENALKGDIEKQFKLDGGSPDKTTVRKAINKFFGSSITNNDLSYTYVTVEPTFYIYKRDSNSHKYYGTIYELLSLAKIRISDTNIIEVREGDAFPTFNKYIYYHFPRSMMGTTITGVDSNKFVGNLVTVVESDNLHNISITSNSTKTNRKANRNLVSGKAGYGITVFWIDSYISKCKYDTCNEHNANSNALLNCAETYCQENTKSESKKRECIIACGYNPSAYSCSTGSTGSATTTTCSATRTASKDTCSLDHDYFKTTCKESTTINYPDLPGKNSLYKTVGKNFNYSITTSGTKTCTKIFNYQLFQLDYASKTNDANRQKLRDKVFNYKYFTEKTNINNNTINYNDDESAWNSKTINNSSNNYTLTWTSNSAPPLTVTDYETKTIELYATNKKNNKYKQDNKEERGRYTSKTTLSTNKGVLSSTSSIPYITEKVGQKSTNTTIKRDSSNLNDTNTCAYTVKSQNTSSEDVSCSAEIISDNKNGNYYTSDVTVKYTISYTKKANQNATPVEQDAGVIKSNVEYEFDNKGGFNKFTDNDIIIENDKIVVERNIKFEQGQTITSVLNLKTTNNTSTGSCKIQVEFSKLNELCSINTSKNGNDEIEVSGNYDTIECTKEDGNLIPVANGKINMEGILGEDNPAEKITCSAEYKGNRCGVNVSLGSCKYIPSAKRDKINKYCSDNNMLDLEGYSDAEDCIKKCSSSSCPADKNTMNFDQISNWCKGNSNTAGYVDAEACINDCTVPDPYSSKYMFRPIKLGENKELTVNKYNAFPSRKAGANWIGVESKTKNDKIFTESPKYVINLDSSNIQKIRENTKSTGKSKAYMPYEHLNQSEKEKTYKSDLVKTYFSVGGGD